MNRRAFSSLCLVCAGLVGLTGCATIPADHPAIAGLGSAKRVRVEVVPSGDFKDRGGYRHGIFSDGRNFMEEILGEFRSFGVTNVVSDEQPADATFRVRIDGRAVEAQYSIGRGSRMIPSGATVHGTIEVVAPGSPLLRRSFSGWASPPSVVHVPVSGTYRPPFASALQSSSFSDMLSDILHKAYGPSINEISLEYAARTERALRREAEEKAEAQLQANRVAAEKDFSNAVLGTWHTVGQGTITYLPGGRGEWSSEFRETTGTFTWSISGNTLCEFGIDRRRSRGSGEEYAFAIMEDRMYKTTRKGRNVVWYRLKRREAEERARCKATARARAEVAADSLAAEKRFSEAILGVWRRGLEKMIYFPGGRGDRQPVYDGTTNGGFRWRISGNTLHESGGGTQRGESFTQASTFVIAGDKMYKTWKRCDETGWSNAPWNIWWRQSPPPGSGGESSD